MFYQNVLTLRLSGSFFTHWIADSVTLWQSPLTDDHLHAAAAYYSILSTMPRWMEFVFVVIGVAAAAALLLNVYDGKAGNIMFDGASLCTSEKRHQIFECLTGIHFS